MVNPIKNVKVFYKILLIIVIILVFMVILAFVMMNGLKTQGGILKEVIEDRFLHYSESALLMADMYLVDREFQVLLYTYPGEIPKEEAKNFSQRVKKILDPHIEVISEILKKPNLTKEEDSKFRNVEAQVVKFRGALVGGIAGFGALGGGMGLENAIGPTKEALNAIREDIPALLSHEQESMKATQDSANQQIKSQQNYFLIACFFAFFIPLLISIFISKAIVDPIRYLVDYSQLIAKGDLSKSCHLDSRDEMGNLSNYFNRVVQSIKDIIIGLKGVQDQNMALKDDLLSSTNETSAAVTQISSNLNSSVSMLSHLNENVDFSVMATDKITGLMEKFRQQLDQQNHAVSRSSSSVESMVNSIKDIARTSSGRSKKSQELLDITMVGAQKMEETNKKVKEMSIVTDDMLQAIDIIKDIAERTNLLSINSAIQAAHAGEAGKSFAVVANEIRKLAESSTDSSKTIANNLKKNVEMIKTLLVVSEETSDSFNLIGSEVRLVVQTLEDISGSLQNLANAGNQIYGAIRGLKDLTGSIHDESASIEEQVGLIKDAVINVNEVTAEVVNAITEINQGAKQINTAMASLNHNATMIEEGIVNASSKINKFIT